MPHQIRRHEWPIYIYIIPKYTCTCRSFYSFMRHFNLTCTFVESTFDRIIFVDMAQRINCQSKCGYAPMMIMIMTNLGHTSSSPCCCAICCLANIPSIWGLFQERGRSPSIQSPPPSISIGRSCTSSIAPHALF